MDNNRRSFIKIMAGIAIAPLSFLNTAAAPIAIAADKIVVSKSRLKCRWTLELQKDLEAMEFNEDNKWKSL